MRPHELHVGRRWRARRVVDGTVVEKSTTCRMIGSRFWGEIATTGEMTGNDVVAASA
jgi:hypothetical protein